MGKQEWPSSKTFSALREWRMRETLVLLLVLLCGSSGQDCKFSSYVAPGQDSLQLRNAGYPAKYQSGSVCYWYYYTDEHHRLTLDCPIVELPYEVLWNCFDKLSVVGSKHYDGDDFCEPFSAQSSDHRLILKLTSGNQTGGGRFMCTVRAIDKEPCNCGWYPQRKIVGGVAVKINDYPMMVSVIDLTKYKHSCGGSIISKNFVLTAAHCLKLLEVKNTGLLVGEDDLRAVNETTASRLIRAAQFIIHPGYDRVWHDIGLIKSATPFEFNNMVGPVCLPFNRPLLPAIGENVTALGWGTTYFGGPISDLLMKTRIQVIPDSRCRAVFSRAAASGKQVCLHSRGNDTCQMDSGGPLLVKELRTSSYYQAAVVSFGPDNCGGYEPSVNTRITPYLNWIQSKTGDKFCIK